MDPRKPELAVTRLKELIKQYDRVEKDMSEATTSAQLSQLEREGGLVVQEMCLVAPRIHEAMMQSSRQRRHDLSRGILIEPQDTAVETPQGGMFEPEIVEEPVMVKLERPLTEKEGKKIVENISADKADEPVEKPVEERELTDEEKKEKERLLALLNEAKEKFSKARAIDKNTGKEYRVLYLELHPYGPDFPETIVTISLKNEDTEIMFKNDEIKDLIDNFEAAPFDNMEPVTESKPKKSTKKKTTKKKTAKKKADK